MLEVVVIGETRLDASLDHLEVGLMEGFGDVLFGIDLLHFYVDLPRFEQASVQERQSHLSLEEFALGLGLLR